MHHHCVKAYAWAKAMAMCSRLIMSQLEQGNTHYNHVSSKVHHGYPIMSSHCVFIMLQLLQN